MVEPNGQASRLSPLWSTSQERISELLPFFQCKVRTDIVPLRWSFYNLTQEFWRSNEACMTHCRADQLVVLAV